MAKGAASKQNVQAVILQTFENSFLYNGGKEIRIPCEEDGQVVQIKLTLTCAKENVSAEGSFPTVTPVVSTQSEASAFPPPKNEPIKATEEEKATVESLVAALGL